jgi:hypothetical protein
MGPVISKRSLQSPNIYLASIMCHVLLETSRNTAMNKKQYQPGVVWHPVKSAWGRLRQEFLEFKASLGYRVRLSQNNPK